MELYEHKFGNGFEEHFGLGEEDSTNDESLDSTKLEITLVPKYETIHDVVVPCAEITISYNGSPVEKSKTTISYYFDDEEVIDFRSIKELTEGNHEFMIVVNYKGIIKIVKENLTYERS